MDIKDFEAAIKPFFWVKYEDTVSVCLDAGEYKAAIFDTWEEEGIEGVEGNGYDWESLAIGFLAERPALAGEISFDPEAGMFCAYSSNEAALREFILGFKDAFEIKLR